MAEQSEQFIKECAMMAGAAYRSSRSDKNQLPVPNGWIYDIEYGHRTRPSGFEASCFVNGDNVVISFAGTFPKDISGDILTDVALACGNFDQQLLDAARYYLDIKKKYSGTSKTITFTGQSLGGGLAALMAVFFDEKAVTFDQAPFEATATQYPINVMDTEILTPAQLLLAWLKRDGYAAASLTNLQSYVDSFNSSGSIYTERESKVTGCYVEGEVLTSDWPYNWCSVIGTQEKKELTAAARANVDSWDLHATALIEAFLLDDRFRVVTDRLTDLLEMILV